MIGFVGLSHLGIVSSLAAAAKGFEVVALDARPGLAAGLGRGELPVLEPGLGALFATHGNRMRFTDDFTLLGGCKVIVLSLDIVTDDANRSDLSGLHTLARQAAQQAPRGATLVVLSQVPPGFTRRLSSELEPVLQNGGLHLYYQVETLVFGEAVKRALEPERFIVGCADPALPLPQAYAAWLAAYGCPVLPMRYESAELSKISINVMLAATLSATNSLAEICENVGADWAEIAPALRLDRRIGPHAYLSAGLGIAGGNIERDLVTLSALAEQYGAEGTVPRAFLQHSRYRRDWVLRALHAAVLSKQASPVMAIWGLAYKPNTHSTKNSPALALVAALRDFKLRLYDPQAHLESAPPNVELAESALAACDGADALVVMTPWDEFSAIATDGLKGRLRRNIVIDPWGIWRHRDLTGEGFQYFSLGRPPR